MTDGRPVRWLNDFVRARTGHKHRGLITTAWTLWQRRRGLTPYLLFSEWIPLAMTEQLLYQDNPRPNEAIRVLSYAIVVVFGKAGPVAVRRSVQGRLLQVFDTLTPPRTRSVYLRASPPQGLSIDGVV